jgi:hypothetical protein
VGARREHPPEEEERAERADDAETTRDQNAPRIPVNEGPTSSRAVGFVVPLPPLFWSSPRELRIQSVAVAAAPTTKTARPMFATVWSVRPEEISLS